MIFSFFCDVTQPRLIVTDVSEQPIGPIFKGQAVQEEKRQLAFEDWTSMFPETSLTDY
jgi:hypothetical protein